MGFLSSLLLLRWFRCSRECGWRGLRFSRSLYFHRRRRLMTAVIIALFVLLATAAVRMVLSRVGSRSSATHDEGIQEVE